MRRIALVLVFVLLASVAFAQTSAGIIIGEPSGLSGRQWIGDGAALDLALAWSFFPEGSFYIHLDYKQHFYDFDVYTGRLLAFAGIGPMVYIGSAVTLGARIPVGLIYEFDPAPLEIFVEVAPGLTLVPRTRANVGGGLGIRYRF